MIVLLLQMKAPVSSFSTLDTERLSDYLQSPKKWWSRSWTQASQILGLRHNPLLTKPFFQDTAVGGICTLYENPFLTDTVNYLPCFSSRLLNSSDPAGWEACSQSASQTGPTDWPHVVDSAHMAQPLLALRAPWTSPVCPWACDLAPGSQTACCSLSPTHGMWCSGPVYGVCCMWHLAPD